MNNDNKKKQNDINSSYLIDESDENTGSVKHPKESHLTPNTGEPLLEQQVPDTGYDSPYLHTVNEVENTPIANSTPVQTEIPGTLPLSNPHAIPRQAVTPEKVPVTNTPELIPVQPVTKTEYVQVAKVKKGGGILGYLFMKIFNCVGCLLLIFSLVIVAFIVWIINF